MTKSLIFITLRKLFECLTLAPKDKLSLLSFKLTHSQTGWTRRTHEARRHLLFTRKIYMKTIPVFENFAQITKLKKNDFVLSKKKMIFVNHSTIPTNLSPNEVGYLLTLLGHSPLSLKLTMKMKDSL